MKPENMTVTVDEYIAGFPAAVQERMKKIRAVIKKNAPGAVEKISYQMPAYSLNGMLLYFAGHAKHIGIYPMPSGILAFKEELKEYKTSPGTIQFPNDKPLPLDLIKNIVKFRVIENQEKVLRIRKR